VVIISPDRRVHEQLDETLGASSSTEAIWKATGYPELAELEQLKQAAAGCVLFLDFTDIARARRIAAEVDRVYPNVSMVAIHNGQTKQDLLGLMQLGIREVISEPISPGDARAALGRAMNKLRGEDSVDRNIHAFIPAKPGAGATTTAVNVAWAMSRLSSERTLLLDFDLRLGLTSFLMKLDGRHSVQDALNIGPSLDENIWDNMVSRRGHLDVLGSAPMELPADPDEEAYTKVLDCAERFYSAVCVDLPGGMEPHEVHTLRCAKEIFLVCTPDLPALHIAKRKADALRRLQLGEKVSIVLNRAERRTPLPIADIERILELPVRFTIPSDERAVSNSVHNGKPIAANSPIGVTIEAIAKSVLGSILPGKAKPAKRRFVDYFSISPMRDRIWEKERCTVD